MNATTILRISLIAVVSFSVLAGTNHQPKINIQRLGANEIDDGAISVAYFIQEPKGKGCAWSATPWVMSYSKKVFDALQIRINGQLHHMKLVADNQTLGPKRYHEVEYQKFQEWSDGKVTVQIYSNVVDLTDSYKCTKGELLVRIKEVEQSFPLWGLSGCE